MAKGQVIPRKHGMKTELWNTTERACSISEVRKAIEEHLSPMRQDDTKCLFYLRVVRVDFDDKKAGRP